MNEIKQSRTLAAAGTGFVMLAVFFLWRDLALPRELLLLAAAVCAALALVLRWPARFPAAAPASLLAIVTVASAWFVAVKDPALLPALAVAVAAAGWGVARAERAPTPGLADPLAWYAFGAAALASTGAFYFHFLTTGLAADSVGRRLVLTLLWLALGLAVLLGRRWRSPAAARVGAALAGCALLKAICYDTTHLQGALRVAVLGAVGALLLLGARVAPATSREEV
jgi:hypothetical protein